MLIAHTALTPYTRSPSLGTARLVGVFAALLGGLSTGCASQHYLLQEAGYTSASPIAAASLTIGNQPVRQQYWGWLSVQESGITPDLSVTQTAPFLGSALRITGLGLRWGADNSLGYFDEIRLSVPPGCRVIVLVRDASEARAAKELLQSTLKESPCAVLSPS